MRRMSIIPTRLRHVDVERARNCDVSFAFNCPVPVCDERGLQVVVTWKRPHCTLYLNGEEVEIQKAQTH